MEKKYLIKFSRPLLSLPIFFPGFREHEIQRTQEKLRVENAVTLLL